MQIRCTRTAIGIVLAAVVVAAVATPAAAQGPPKDQLAVTAGTSTGTNGPKVPITPGNSPNQFRYEYCLAPESSFSDTYPIQFVLTNNNSQAGQSVSVNFTQAGSPQLSATAPALSFPFSITDNAVAVNESITVSSSGGLVAGEYNLNVHLTATPASGVQLTRNTLHINIVVSSDDCTTPIKCFLTSSDFDPLRDCNGDPVFDSTGGTFVLVRGGRGQTTIVATNPGQIYYNLLWRNPGGADSVTISLSATNLAPKGAQAVHAKTFDSNDVDFDDLSNLTASQFIDVNDTGMPCGTDASGGCTILVGEGETLWVTWHLEYSGIGSGIPNGATNVCPGNVTISATGSLTGSLNPFIGNCTATATGYLNK